MRQGRPRWHETGFEYGYAAAYALRDSMIPCGAMAADNRNRILMTLRALEPDLRARGVRHVSVFGSVARGEDTLNSDVDLALDLASGGAPEGFQFTAFVDEIKRSLAAALSRSVDIVILPARRQDLAQTLRREAIVVF